MIKKMKNDKSGPCINQGAPQKDWTKVQPYNIGPSLRLLNPAGMIHLVAKDFNPLKRFQPVDVFFRLISKEEDRLVDSQLIHFIFEDSPGCPEIFGRGGQNAVIPDQSRLNGFPLHGIKNIVLPFRRLV